MFVIAIKQNKLNCYFFDYICEKFSFKTVTYYSIDDNK